MWVVPGLQAAPQNAAFVNGLVKQQGTSEAIPNVTVKLTPLGSVAAGAVEDGRGAASTAVSATTNIGGRFEFRGIPSGEYTITVARDGYLRPKRGGGPERLLISAQQEIKDMTFTMVRGASIFGQAVDAEGKPVPNVNVQVFEIAYRDGRRMLSPGAGFTSSTLKTNARGEYRAAWLFPGEYYVRVQAQSSAGGRQVTAYSLFYPGTPEAGSAAPIWIREGDEMRLDLRIPPIERRDAGVKITGKVIVETAEEVAPYSVSTIGLIPLEPNKIVPSYQLPFTNVLSSPDGRFEIRGVQPGSYTVSALLSSKSLLTALPSLTPISVSYDDIEDLAVVVPSAVNAVQGDVVIRGDKSSVDIAALQIQLGPLYAASGPETSVDADGTFTLEKIAPSPYRLHISGLPPQAYVEDIIQGGRSVSDTGIVNIDKNPDPIRIIVNTGAGTIQGTVLKGLDQTATAQATVALVPAWAKRQNLSLYKSAITGQDGNFMLTGIAPGDYKLFAWENIPGGAYQNAEFLAAYEARGQIVTVTPASALNVHVTVIPSTR